MWQVVARSDSTVHGIASAMQADAAKRRPMSSRLYSIAAMR